MSGRPKKFIAQSESISEMKILLLVHGKVNLTRVGIFSLKKMSARMVPNRWNGDMKKVEERMKICFKPDKAWIKNINEA